MPVDSTSEQTDWTEAERGFGLPSAPAVVKEEVPGAPSLVVYCLGPFRVYQDDQPVTEWPSAKGKAIFKYLIAHRQRPVVKEILMELFWPEMDPDAARNNLNVAIYGLRQALRAGRPTFSHVLYQDDCYLINPELRIWVDSEAFDRHYAAAQTLQQQSRLSEAMAEYRAAEALYQGEYMEEDRYEDWMIPRRRRLEARYLDLLDRLVRYSYDREHDAACIALCHKTLAVDACREEAHRRLMRCYSRQGQPYLALRQYHLCVEALREELDVPPAEQTLALYQRIRAGEEN
jgi:DNA-binding SARP family transcriptional activator